MIMADVFKILFLILGMILCTVSYWLLFVSLFSGKVERMQRAIVARPNRIFLIGVLAGVPLTLLGLALAGQGAGPLKLLGLVVLTMIGVAGLFGSTGLVRQVGQGLTESRENRGGSNVVLRGGGVVAIACVLPVIGWFFVLPVVLIIGFGAVLHLLWPRKSVPGSPETNAGAVQV